MEERDAGNDVSWASTVPVALRQGMDRFNQIHEMIKSDPERALPEVLSFVHRYSSTSEAQDLIQDLVYEWDTRFLDRLEAAALNDQLIADAIDQSYVGGFATEGAEQFQQLQDRLRRSRDQ
jgi:hypothetical protein